MKKPALGCKNDYSYSSNKSSASKIEMNDNKKNKNNEGILGQEDVSKFAKQNSLNRIQDSYRNFPSSLKMDFLDAINKNFNIHSNLYNLQTSEKKKLKLKIKSPLEPSKNGIKTKITLVDPTSEKIMTMKKRIPVVEERLLKEGMDLAIRKEESIRKKEKELNILLTPKIMSSISLNISEGTPKEDIITRLLKYKDIYASKKENLNNKYYQNESFRFKPEISNNSLNNYVLANYTKRNFSKPRLNATSQNEYSFHPQLNKNSIKIAFNLPNFEDRILMPKALGEKLTDFIHKPSINSRSNEIALNLSSRKGCKNLFEKLYLDSIELKNKLELRSKQNQAHESKGLSECTFKPSINRSYSSSSIHSQEPLYLRTSKWKENKEKKMESEKIKCDRIINAECTFNPSSKRLDIKDDERFKSLGKVKNENKYILRLTSLKKLKEDSTNHNLTETNKIKEKNKNSTKSKEFVLLTKERSVKRLKKS